MDAKPRRRWFQFNLASLLIVVLAAGIVFGRVAHLKRWADYHEQEAERLVSEYIARGWSREFANEIIELKKDAPNRTTYWDVANHHDLAKEYRAAVYRPWTTVEEKRFPNNPFVERKDRRSKP